MTAAALSALLALLLSGPVPVLLSRTAVIRHAPRAAMTLWQAVALAAVLSALGSTLALAASFGLHEGATSGWEYAAAAVCLALTALVAGRLLLSGHRVGRRLRLVRRRHRELLALLAHERDGVLVVEDDGALAYCVPRMLRGDVVLSEGVTRLLTDDQLTAVVAHERAHLAARHDLVLEAFEVLHRAFPRALSSRRARDEVRLLAEVLADAAARRRSGSLVLGRALLVLTSAGADRAVPTGAVGAQVRTGPGQLAARLDVLTCARSHRGLAASLYLVAVALLVLPTVFVALPWMTRAVG